MLSIQLTEHQIDTLINIYEENKRKRFLSAYRTRKLNEMVQILIQQQHASLCERLNLVGKRINM